MATPSNPNFDPTKDIRARLVTDRYDFQKHIDGEDFFQEATSVTLVPPVDISGDRNNVREAIIALSQTVGVGAPDATTTTKGILQLTNDLSGTATSPVVTGIRGLPVSSLGSIGVGDYLEWNGTSFVAATPAITAFVAGDDLAGTATSQQVIGLTGANVSGNDVVDITADRLTFSSSVISPHINWETTTAQFGNTLKITSQDSSHASGAGGNLEISTGTGNSYHGSMNFLFGDSLDVGSVVGLSLHETTDNRRIYGFGVMPTTSFMPSNTGDSVIYVNNADTNPSANPISGAILYSNGGSLHTRRSSGVNFEIGDAQSIDGYNVVAPSPSNGDTLVYNFSLSRWENAAGGGAFTAANDLSGTSSTQTVIGLRGISLNSSLASLSGGDSGKVLSFNGTDWTAVVSGNFVANNDLTGDSSTQTVIQMTGYNDGYVDRVDVVADEIIFNGDSVDRVVAGGENNTGDGYDMYVIGQHADRDDTDGYGGDLYILAGAGTNEFVSSGILNLGYMQYFVQYDQFEYIPQIALSVMQNKAESRHNIFISKLDSWDQNTFSHTTENCLFFAPGDFHSNDITHLDQVLDYGALYFSNQDNLMLVNVDGKSTLNFEETSFTHDFGSVTAGNVVTVPSISSSFPTPSSGRLYEVFIKNTGANGLIYMGVNNSSNNYYFYVAATGTYDGAEITVRFKGMNF